MRENHSKLKYLAIASLLLLIALTGHAAFPMGSIVPCATVVLFVVFVVVKFRAKVSCYVKALTGVNKKERHRDFVSSSNFPPPDDCPLLPTLPESVTRSDVDSIDRAAWVLRLTHHVFSERQKKSHNVIVINDNLEYQFDAQGILERFLVKYHVESRVGLVPYLVVVFREGTLVNMGDGGDINWDWQGNFIRSGNKELIFKPCVPGIVYRHGP